MKKEVINSKYTNFASFNKHINYIIFNKHTYIIIIYLPYRYTYTYIDKMISLTRMKHIKSYICHVTLLFYSDVFKENI